jgi:hypothetical protein
MKGIRSDSYRRGYDLVELRASAGVWMREYRQRPWSLLLPRLRDPVIRRIASSSPALFGCQYVVKAVTQSNS